MIAGAVGNSLLFNYNQLELVESSFRTINLRLYAGYKFMELYGSKSNFRYEAFAYGGVRIYIQRLRADLSGTNFKLDINPVLTEPIIGLENQFTWKRWLVNVQGDYGNIFARNKRSIQITAFVLYRMGRTTSLKVGWNHLYINLSSTFLRQDYNVKMTLSGPSVGVSFNF